MLTKYRNEDCQGKNNISIRKREEKQIKTLLNASDNIDRILQENDKRLGHSGKEVQSNITDNESAKMKTSNGVIQGYRGVSAVDSKYQIVVSAEAYGQGQEHGLLEPMVEKIDSTLGRHIYSMRLGIVEPVFGYINDAIGIKRFSLRGKKKVNAQWQLLNMLYNLTKVHRFGAV